MNFGSVCSGIEAASMAWKPLGWRPQFVSEIDRFPCELLKVRHPDVPNFGDMTKFHEWPDANIDVLVGGTPCQSFSVAGLRKGLDDPRGNLMLTYLAIAARYRPRWLVWENVPGVLSSNEGRDFGSLLAGMAELRYGFAYRVLDAQYFNLAQRRERVFVVGCIGDWRSAAAVLFDSASLHWNLAPDRQAGAFVAAGLTAGPHPGSNAPGRRREDDVNLVSHALLAKPNDAHDASMMTYVATTLGANSGRNQLEATYLPIAFNARQDPDSWLDRTGPLDTDGGTQAVAFHENQRGEISLNDTAGAINRGGGKPGQGYPAVQAGMAVRRLTPRECERLQGFPDDYTLIDFKGKPAKDGVRYKGIGNSMARPVMEWLGKRIDMYSQSQSKGGE
jgi:DNA (cytosine-5)-methyltransferase 1